MEIQFLDKFGKDLDNIHDIQIKDKVLKLIDKIECCNKLSELPNVKKLSGYRFSYRVKIGDYRIGFFFENNIVELARIIHRKDIYKVFP
jgi:mRNA interferase RelE/StbE